MFMRVLNVQIERKYMMRRWTGGGGDMTGSGALAEAKREGGRAEEVGMSSLMISDIDRKSVIELEELDFAKLVGMLKLF